MAQVLCISRHWAILQWNTIHITFCKNISNGWQVENGGEKWKAHIYTYTCTQKTWCSFCFLHF